MQKLKLFAGSFLTALFLFPAFCQAQTVLIVSGNGQLACPDCPLNPEKYVPLVVQVNDAASNPVANATVTWTTTQLGDAAVTATSTTDSAGQASYPCSGSQCPFTPLPLAIVSDFYLTTVVASATVGTVTASATFYETTGEPAGAGTADTLISLVPAAAPPVLTGGVPGSTAKPILVSVLGQNGGLPNIQVSGHRSYGFLRCGDVYPSLWLQARIGGLYNRHRRDLHKLLTDSVFGRLRTA